MISLCRRTPHFVVAAMTRSLSGLIDTAAGGEPAWRNETFRGLSCNPMPGTAPARLGDVTLQTPEKTESMTWQAPLHWHRPLAANDSEHPWVLPKTPKTWGYLKRTRIVMTNSHS